MIGDREDLRKSILLTFFVILMKKFYPIHRDRRFLLTGSRFQKIIGHRLPWVYLG